MQFRHLAIAVSLRLEVEISGHASLDGCNFQRFLSMMGLKSIHVGKREPLNIPAPAPEGVIFKALFHDFNMHTGVF